MHRESYRSVISHLPSVSHVWVAAAVAGRGQRAVQPAYGITLPAAPSADHSKSFGSCQSSLSWVLGPCSHGFAPRLLPGRPCRRLLPGRAVISSAALLRGLLGLSSYCCCSWWLLASLGLCLHFQTVVLTLRTLSLQDSRHVTYVLSGF